MQAALARDNASDAAPRASPQPDGRSQTRVVLLLGMLVVLPVLVAIAYFATRSVLPEASLLKFAVSQGNSSLIQAQYLNVTSMQQVSGQLFPSLNPQTLAVPLQVNPPSVDFVGLLLVTVAAVVILIFWRGLRTRRVRTAPFEDSGNLLAEKRRKLA